MMPLMTFFITFTVPVGLGIYWATGGLIRAGQQFFLNRHFEKINLEDIIEKNKEKAEKKRKDDRKGAKEARAGKGKRPAEKGKKKTGPAGPV
jgi:YidC/Oxa1 family membrane protein insertase